MPAEDASPERFGPDLPGRGDRFDLEIWESRWPHSAEKIELLDGCAVFSGGPWDDRDLATAERTYPGQIAVLGGDGYGICVCPDEHTADDLIRRYGGSRRSRR